MFRNMIINYSTFKDKSLEELLETFPSKLKTGKYVSRFMIHKTRQNKGWRVGYFGKSLSYIKENSNLKMAVMVLLTSLINGGLLKLTDDFKLVQND